MTAVLTEREALLDSVRSFAQRHLADGALPRAHDPNYSWDIAQLLGAQGLLGLTISAEDGGQGAGLADAVAVIQEVAMVCPKSADILQAGNFGAIRTFAEFGTPEQKAKYLSDLIAGRTLIGLGMSEPEAGSAATELTTSATEDGDGYRINGTKIWGTHSVDATLFLVYVRFGPGTGNIGSILVERGTKGLTLGTPSTYMSGEQWAQLYFDDCWVPKGNVLLGPGGFKKQMSGFNVERIGNASRALALGRLAFNLARDHVSERTQFGRTLNEFQGLQWKFAEVAVALDSAELLLDRAVRNAAAGLPSAYETSVAKLAANEAGFKAANEAMQAMGALGYSTESLVEYCMRRTRGWMIAGGSIEILKNRIAEEIFGRRFSQRR
ncbi:acyl-CoA dehydrogenase [Rhodococcus opacus PD630]|uniref:acyl-CoA dehydrogenase family protein n=1 Tax=Rhodococcus opacus TaxID=37919 RepID=UPI00029CB1A5|nr:acyl-CoA dehydrogenase [Rhodococcus opacus]AHK31942.1 Acyl-CoA dehydrogenase, short-chain specific [Rhodococcus opacus PD630]EHI45231.1 acyl-CoA dehydrogenase [Rhodococcus opacus PD630]KXF49437.1 acyl-CoA dehydrogenase [Rhodococcus sp. SC4]UDG94398.1 acyl-CoA dehydrogenase [Rhodococcus opacus PD630]